MSRFKKSFYIFFFGKTAINEYFGGKREKTAFGRHLSA
jgi:hypothetical protein